MSQTEQKREPRVKTAEQVYNQTKRIARKLLDDETEYKSWMEQEGATKFSRDDDFSSSTVLSYERPSRDSEGVVKLKLRVPKEDVDGGFSKAVEVSKDYKSTKSVHVFGDDDEIHAAADFVQHGDALGSPAEPFSMDGQIQTRQSSVMTGRRPLEYKEKIELAADVLNGMRSPISRAKYKATKHKQAEEQRIAEEAKGIVGQVNELRKK